MTVKYTYKENNGVQEHNIDLHENYDPFLGIIDNPVVTIKSSNYIEVLKNIENYLSDESILMLKSLLKTKLSGIITNDGKYHNL